MFTGKQQFCAGRTVFLKVLGPGMCFLDRGSSSINLSFFLLVISRVGMLQNLYFTSLQLHSGPEEKRSNSAGGANVTQDEI